MSVKRQHRKDEEKSTCDPSLKRHTMMYNTKEMKIEVGDVIVIEGEEKKRKVEHQDNGRIVQG